MLIKQKKFLGQNFIKNPVIIKKIVDSLEITSSDHVIEIGSGLGYLTKGISEQCNSVMALEIDSKLISLAKSFCNSQNVIFLEQDVLKIN
jgi:16S rRNA (adenine1518-N6/adenine1519-N6)-dimethyltransferase